MFASLGTGGELLRTSESDALS